jgi:hypothetical protein
MAYKLDGKFKEAIKISLRRNAFGNECQLFSKFKNEIVIRVKNKPKLHIYAVK